ncbi:AMP-binding protein [Schinkia azotoformans]|uniref:AMP-binding protein n=1 Tax=Schinkia azotoformans TaxID=1454 RepID=UPI002E21C296|nr:AMP-binding protein [Schinkia azotoformans]
MREKMYFWNIEKDDERIAIIDQNDSKLTYGNLFEKVQMMKDCLPDSSRKRLGLILCQNQAFPIMAYLAALQRQDAVMLLDEKLDEALLLNIVNTYKPDWIFSVDRKPEFPSSYKFSDHTFFQIWTNHTNEEMDSIHPDLAVLLSTSGTTGSAKFVRLSYQNLQANAESIVNYLPITTNERAITTLPMQYSYGLSVINSHLLAQGPLILTDASMLSKEFWSLFHEHNVTSFAGVPYTYQMLQRLRFEKMDLPSLRYFTQAGGRLAPTLVDYFAKCAHDKGVQFFVMYGQTEATARISYVPPERILEKKESIGVPIPNGKLWVDEDTSELLYEGPNVMMGYAETRQDLAKGDELNGLLHTGDLGRVDNGGFFYITGRMKRFIKLFGLRLNLDDIEKRIEQQQGIVVACVGNDDRLLVFLENGDLLEPVKQDILKVYKLHPSVVKVSAVSKLPRFENGKINYNKLKDL